MPTDVTLTLVVISYLRRHYFTCIFLITFYIAVSIILSPEVLSKWFIKNACQGCSKLCSGSRILSHSLVDYL